MKELPSGQRARITFWRLRVKLALLMSAFFAFQIRAEFARVKLIT